MKLVGARPNPKVLGQDELPGKVNYFLGNDPSKWRANVPTYARVHYEGVYPGIDVVYYGNQRQLEYDFVVQPGAEVEAIGMRFTGADRLTLDADGSLVFHVVGGELRQPKPVIYQEIEGQRREIDGGYILTEKNHVGFRVGRYDSSKPLIIDPTMVYSTFLGGSGDDVAYSIAVDGTGYAYVTGYTMSSDFPTTSGAFDTTYHGGIAGNDVFVTKLNPDGSAPLVYSTFLGGSHDEEARGIAVDGTGSAFVTGETLSTDFPTTPGAFDTTHNGAADTRH